MFCPSAQSGLAHAPRRKEKALKTFRPKLFEALRDYSASKLVNDLIAGVIVAIIALPLSIALAIASGVSPEQGLYTAIVAGFIIALLGGSRVNISGPTAAFAAIVAGIVATHGIAGLTLAAIIAGVLLILMGVFRFGSLINYIPMTLTVGFTAGIAVTIIIGQIKDFLGLTFAPGTNAIETLDKVKAIAASIGTINPHAVIVGLIGLAILILWPLAFKNGKSKVSLILAKVPASIIAPPRARVASCHPLGKTRCRPVPSGRLRWPNKPLHPLAG